MSDSSITPNADTTPEPGSATQAKGHFAKAIEEAKAGARALASEAQERAGTYREKANTAGNEWIDEARTRSDEARARAAEVAQESKARAAEMAQEGKVRAAELAQEGKAGASRAIAGLGKMVGDNAAQIDEKFGVTYGDYARTAARTMQDAADKLDKKEFSELGDDAREFVRKSPGTAIGIAAVAGFMLARLFRGSKD